MALVASGNIVVADTAADPTAVKSENGKYLDKEGKPIPGTAVTIRSVTSAMGRMAWAPPTRRH